jgi:acetolactate synthase regulatory subunit
LVNLSATCVELSQRSNVLVGIALLHCTLGLSFTLVTQTVSPSLAPTILCVSPSTARALHSCARWSTARCPSDLAIATALVHSLSLPLGTSTRGMNKTEIFEVMSQSLDLDLIVHRPRSVCLACTHAHVMSHSLALNLVVHRPRSVCLACTHAHVMSQSLDLDLVVHRPRSVCLACTHAHVHVHLQAHMNALTCATNRQRRRLCETHERFRLRNRHMEWCTML